MDYQDVLNKLGLGNLDIDSCEVSHYWKGQLLQLLQKYEDVFSKTKLDCGSAKDIVHRIHLSDTRPFRLPYRRVPPGQYHKLRQVLSEMEELEIIRKSKSEWGSPLVLVWKKNGDLGICVDYRWLNARTIKDAHPLPHQADCLAALGGSSIFCAMDLTSGFYNIAMVEEDKKLTAFTTPMGLYEFNRLPQGLCNSPASFMRLMMSIFGDQNFLTLLCYLDDMLVYAPNEAEALKRLEMVFSRLRAHGLKLAPKKCQLLRRSVKFLGHVVDSTGVATDPDKVKAITSMTVMDLMMEDGITPSQKKIKSFLGMVMYYQQFIQDCSSIAKPLFALTAAPKGQKEMHVALLLSESCMPMTGNKSTVICLSVSSQHFCNLSSLLILTSVAHLFCQQMLRPMDWARCWHKFRRVRQKHGLWLLPVKLLPVLKANTRPIVWSFWH